MQDIVEEILKHRPVYIVSVSDTNGPSRILSLTYNYERACATVLREAVRELNTQFYDPLQRFVQSRSLRWSSWEDGHMFWQDRWSLRGISMYTVEEWVPDSAHYGTTTTNANTNTNTGDEKNRVTHCILDHYVKRLVSSANHTRAELMQKFSEWKAWASAADCCVSDMPELAGALDFKSDADALSSQARYGGHTSWKLTWA